MSEATFRLRTDPVTFAVLRHRLWSINEEAATTVRQVSGSPVATEANDMNTAIMTAAGEVFVVGYYGLTKATTLEAVVREIINTCSENPGIRPGDAFICNDPYVGVMHQNDVAYVAPVFHGGECIAWVGAEIHQVDVGGPNFGQVQVGARDIFGEQPLIPPVKLVEGGVVRQDIERLYLRHSRLPQLVALDLKAKIAAANVATRRLLDLCREYGLDTVKDVMADMLDYVEYRFRERLRELPDGTWRTRTYVDFEDTLYPMQLAMTKDGDRLVLDWSGTAQQASAVINCTRPGLIALLAGNLCTTLCWDIPWCPAAIIRAVEFITEPGTVVDAAYPSGVSKATTSVGWCAGKTCLVTTGKLLAASDGYRDRASAAWQGGKTVEELHGVNQRGHVFGATLLDAMAGGSGARTWKDGIDTGGYYGSMGARIANVESYEAEYPILYLYRRQMPDTGGPGTFRGGVGVSMMYVVHGVERIPEKIMHCIGAAVPLSNGSSGGYPAATNQFYIKRHTDVQAQLAAGTVPQDLADLDGTLEVHPAISRTYQDRNDVYMCVNMGGGGWGDPLERDPALVQRDLEHGLVTPAAAGQVYGVVLQDGAVDGAATARRRDELRAQRRQAAAAYRARAPRFPASQPPAPPAPPPGR